MARKVSDIRRVSRKEIRELSDLAVVDEALSAPDPMFEARVLPDGRVLMVLRADGSANLYPSRAAVEGMWRRYKETKRRTIAQFRTGFPDPCLTLLPPIDDFLRDIEALAKSLGPRLKIPVEVLDLTPESLDAVDKALEKIPWAKRQVPDLVTPLVAYLGEVMRKATGGQWSKGPTTRKRKVPVYDPAEMEAFNALWATEMTAALAAGEKAAAEAKPRDAVKALHAPSIAVQQRLNPQRPKPIRFDVVEEPIRGHENEPMITTRCGGIFQPFASVYLPMVEPSRRIPLRSSPGVMVTRPNTPRPPPAA